MDNRNAVTKDFIEALTLYVSAMSRLNKEYIQAVADINEMFNRRIEGITNEAIRQTPLS